MGMVDKKAAPVIFKQAEFPIPMYHPGQLGGESELVIYENVQKVSHGA